MTTPAVPAVPAVLDLDAERADRARALAARHEGMGSTLPVWFGGQVIAELEPEFAMEVLEPLTTLDVDIAFIVRALVQAAQAGGRDKAIEQAGLLVDVLVANPNLPAGLISAVKEITARVLGEEGYAAFTAMKPTPWDVRALATGILRWYGLSLGEFLPSESSPEGDGGETSKQTSRPSTGSTPAASGARRARKGSSARAAS